MDRSKPSWLNPNERLTDNFRLSEFITTSTGLDNTPKSFNLQFIRAMANLLQNVRGVLGRPIYINSCYRSPLVNKAVGGSKTSYHLTGCAVDLSIMHLNNEERATFERALRYYFPREFIKYDTFWHVAFDFNHLGNRDIPVSTIEQDYPELREPVIESGDF